VVRDKNIYFIASCCDWLPILMKTRRVLQIEKLAMDEPVPPTILNYDDIALMYANFVPPG
jgi:hypothetical protein